MTSCASVSERIHSSSSNWFEVGSFSLLRNISCVLNKKRHSSGKSPVAHLIVRMSRRWNRPLLWPAHAKETMPSRCSCRSPAGPGALTGDSFDVEQRSDTCFASTLLPHRAPRPFVSPSSPGGSRRLGALRTGGMSSNALRGATDQSLHGFADGSSGCQGTGSLPALFVCLWLHPSCRSARRPRALLPKTLEIRSVICPDFHR